jgi:hypothetical protein
MQSAPVRSSLPALPHALPSAASAACWAAAAWRLGSDAARPRRRRARTPPSGGQQPPLPGSGPPLLLDAHSTMWSRVLARRTTTAMARPRVSSVRLFSSSQLDLDFETSVFDKQPYTVREPL